MHLCQLLYKLLMSTKIKTIIGWLGSKLWITLIFILAPIPGSACPVPMLFRFLIWLLGGGSSVWFLDMLKSFSFIIVFNLSIFLIGIFFFYFFYFFFTIIIKLKNYFLFNILKIFCYYLISFFSNGWYLDICITALSNFICNLSKNIFYYTIDKGIIYFFGPEGLTNFILYISRKISFLQSGFIFNYIFLTVIGIFFIFLLITFW